MCPLRLFLCGDVMTGRGIDQVLPRPCDPGLHEEYITSALGYLRLAEQRNGAIPRPVDPTYIWGAAIEEWARAKPDIRIVNLETSITRSEDFADKGINYRMSPENADCLAAAAIDCCVLANNHVLDWGRAGLRDTLATLQRLNIKTTGAGRDLAEVSVPAILPVAGKARVLVFSYALPSSGTPRSWAANPDAAGVNLLPNLSTATADRVCGEITRARHPGDIVVVALHWGTNWGYDIPAEQTRFAHAVIDRAGVSVVHGHSSHHAKGVELYHNRLILYGCGDFIDDYEGIEGYEDFRDDLVVMYFADIDPITGDITAAEIVPLQIRRFQLTRPTTTDLDWVQQRLTRECDRFGSRVVATGSGRLTLTGGMAPETQ
jgi:poly-gamma-glutamate capsule biosynthesis protein CapA/YwtB (metallophosphatase superfamily)